MDIDEVSELSERLSVASSMEDIMFSSLEEDGQQQDLEHTECAVSAPRRDNSAVTGGDEGDIEFGPVETAVSADEGCAVKLECRIVSGLKPIGEQ